ncbi:Sap4p NDAI_0I03130 [Naumovozyma dairenensis CBS 421]|uniref:SIT4 phosphatase-associated protein n=1 Tax=Naumovozyma dairenensis (strain ATCC 10597 / BCRC 20456 / CBS 421 / NBRC 0211 / NRRL Y-12639) TaxID=1071378 RepID=G0WGH0_NAUDC|nr:hypothetical protein NDAI_0I03130 [Naumovozyma dairenensis CBS 421]CCD26881.1 hypothetical protein NDAI_0I03130 [Naumovozyma dairenensis CBS 421]
MSFWPFSQSTEDANINKILDEYFTLMDDLKKLNLLEENNQNTLDTGNALDRIIVRKENNYIDDNVHDTAIQSTDDGKKEERKEGEDPNSGTETETEEDEHEHDEDEDRESYTNEPKEINRKRKRRQDSKSTIPDNLQENLSIYDLDNSFLERILEEPTLLNELNRQNAALLDFICFGFYFDKFSNKLVKNIKYLIDELLSCINGLGTTGPTESTRPSSSSSSSSSSSYFLLKEHDDNSTRNPNLIVQQLEAESKETTLIERANIISEILSMDTWLITESLIKNKDYLNQIWSILENPNFENERYPLLPIYLKINENLLLTRQDQYLNFIRSKKTLADDFLNHIEIPLMLDFFLKILSTDKLESPTGILELLDDQKLIQKCLKFLDNEKYDSGIQACACDFVKAIIAISANVPLDDMSIGPNCLTRMLSCPEIVDQLLDLIINERGAALNNTITIVIELIRKNNSDYDEINLLNTSIKNNFPSNRDPIYLGYLLKKFSNRLADIFQIVIDIESDSLNNLKINQLNQSYKPLGFERIKIVELIAELLHCSNMGLMNSKRAERIANKRARVRSQLPHKLQNALQDLVIGTKNPARTSNKHENEDRKSNSSSNLIHTIDSIPTNEAEMIENVSDDSVAFDDSTDQDVIDELDETDVEDSEEIDETFDIPYINHNQNDKLRNNPTGGDLFKIKLYDLQIIPKIINLFLEYPWNNFWHNVVFDIIQQLFNGRMDFSYNSFLIYSLFNLGKTAQFVDRKNGSTKLASTNFKITRDFILRGYHDSFKFYEKWNTNLGFMGHLVLVAEEIVKFSKLYKVELISPDIQAVLQEEDWIFYIDEVLNDTRIMYSKILGGGSFIDDGNGNIVPHFPEALNEKDERLNTEVFSSETKTNDESSPNIETLEEQLILSTEFDLHSKLRDMLIERCHDEGASMSNTTASN